MSRKEKKREFFTLDGKNEIEAFRSLPSAERANGRHIYGGADIVKYANGILAIYSGDPLPSEAGLTEYRNIPNNERMLEEMCLTPDLKDSHFQKERNEACGARYDEDGNLIKKPKYF